MIRNIIFDMGNVLIRYDPVYFVERTGLESPADRALLLKEIFHSPKWPLLDKGEMTERELEDHVRCILPEHLHKPAHRLIFHWNEPLEPIPGMAEFVADCKNAGLRIFLLSNASFRQPEYWHEIPGSGNFDGAVISAFESCVKPSADIYNCLLERFHLKAEECFFVDDVEENINGAKGVGIDGFVFRGNVHELREALAAVPGLQDSNLL